MPLHSQSPGQPSRLETFRKTSLFSSLTQEDQDRLAALAVEKRYKAGEPLFFEATPCEGLHVIAQGSVKITKMSSTGREIMLAIESAPNSVAEVPLFDDGLYPATVVAVRDCVIYLLRKEDFRRFCASHPQVPLRMLGVVGKRLRQLVQVIEAVTFGSVRQRVAAALIQAAERQPDGEMAVNLTHEELAARLGTVREVVSRNLSRFQAEGHIQIVKRQIQVLDRQALQAEAETEY